MLNGKGHDGSEDEDVASSDALTRDAPALAPPPAQIAELAAACVRFVSARYGVALDGTQDTLSLLDQYVREARGKADVSPASASGPTVGSALMTPDALALVQGAVGAYLGEVLRQTFRGFWFVEGDPAGWRVDLETVFLTFNPIGMAREALTLEPAEGWHAHLGLAPTDNRPLAPLLPGLQATVDEAAREDREELDRRLTALGELDEEEYYAPTTRYEVVQIAVDVLRARMIERGLGDIVFTPEDYKRM